MTTGMKSSPDRSQRLGQIVRALVSGVDTEELADIIVRQGLAGLHASGAGFAFLADGRMYRVGAVGSTASSVRRAALAGQDELLKDPNPCYVAIRTGHEVWITDRAAGRRRFPCLTLRSAESQGWVALPLKRRGRTFGAFSLSFLAPPAFDEIDRRFVRALGDLAALALAPHFTGPADAGSIGSPTDLAGSPDLVADLLGRAMARTSGDGLVVTDSGGTIVQCNDRLCEMLGYTARQLIGRSVEILLPYDRREEHARHRLRYLDDPVPRSEGSGLDLVALRAGGTELPVEVTLSPGTTPEGLRTFAVVRPRV